MLKAVSVCGGCLKHCKKVACGNIEPSFPPVTFLYCVKQNCGAAEALVCSSEVYINEQVADASCKQNGN